MSRRWHIHGCWLLFSSLKVASVTCRRNKHCLCLLTQKNTEGKGLATSFMSFCQARILLRRQINSPWLCHLRRSLLCHPQRRTRGSMRDTRRVVKILALFLDLVIHFMTISWCLHFSAFWTYFKKKKIVLAFETGSHAAQAGLKLTA